MTSSKPRTTSILGQPHFGGDVVFQVAPALRISTNLPRRSRCSCVSFSTSSSLRRSAPASCRTCCAERSSGAPLRVGSSFRSTCRARRAAASSPRSSPLSAAAPQTPTAACPVTIGAEIGLSSSDDRIEIFHVFCVSSTCCCSYRKSGFRKRCSAQSLMRKLARASSSRSLITSLWISTYLRVASCRTAFAWNMSLSASSVMPGSSSRSWWRTGCVCSRRRDAQRHAAHLESEGQQHAEADPRRLRRRR